MLKIKYDGYQPGLASMLYQFFDKKSVATHSNTSGGAIKKEVISNHQLDEERHKPNIRKLKKKRKVYSSFKDNTWGADLVDMQLISKYNKGIHFLICFIDISSKYAWTFFP